MKRIHVDIRFVGIAVAMSAFVFVACSSDSAPTPEGTQNFNNGVQNPCLNTTTTASQTTSTSVALMAETTYEQNVKSIIDSKCLSCHTSSATKLSNYDEVSLQKYDITSVLAGTLASTSHTGLSLTDSEKQILTAWKDSGYPRGTALSNTGTSVVTTPSSSTNCGNGAYNPGTISTSTTTSTEFDFAILLNSDRAKRCESSNQVVNRDEKNGQPECFSATVDMTWCGSAQAIAQKFGDVSNAKAALEAEFARLAVGTAGGFEIDKCGLESGKPLVTLYKKIPAEKRLDLRVIRSGS